MNQTSKNLLKVLKKSYLLKDLAEEELIQMALQYANCSPEQLEKVIEKINQQDSAMQKKIQNSQEKMVQADENLHAVLGEYKTFQKQVLKSEEERTRAEDDQTLDQLISGI